MAKRRLFLDIDGTLAIWRTTVKYEDIFEKGYFANLPSQHNVVAAAKKFLMMHEEWEVFTLSAYPLGSKYAIEDKMFWLNQHLCELPVERQLFVPCGNCKAQFIPGGLTREDVLLDDYTANLIPWSEMGTGVKLLNGINHTNKTWKGKMVHKDAAPHEIVRAIEEAVAAAV